MQKESFDHGSDPNFLAYYARESESEATVSHFSRVRDRMLLLWTNFGGGSDPLDVLDIGCGTGTQSRLWAQLGHRVVGLDVNEPLIGLARARAASEGLSIRFDVGTATALPYGDAIADVCLMPELLEHVADWRTCLTEAARVLRSGGILYLSTSNWLCPAQQEFALPLYSWYPGRLKRYFERLAITTRPKLANYATYPAVNWFSFYELRDFLAHLGISCFDRFDMLDTTRLGRGSRLVAKLVRRSDVFRLIGYMCTEGTTVYGVKEGGRRGSVGS